MEELNYGKSIERLSETMSTLMSPDEELKPLTFTINGETYETILGTDNDRILSKKNNQEYTTAAFLKHAAKDEANKLSIRIQCPEKILLLGQTSRMRIIRAVQAHHAHAQVTEITKLFTPVFKYYLDKIENKSIIGSEYRAALWATGHDEDLAAAHFINFGLANQPKDPMPGASMHKLTVQEDGILIEIHYPMSFEQRFQDACAAASIEALNQMLGGRKPKFNELQSMIMRAFYYSGGYYCSVPASYRQEILNKITPYINKIIDGINPTLTPTIPSLQEPEFLVPEETFLLKWADFQILEGATTAQIQHNRKNNQDKLLQSLIDKIGHLDPNQEYKFSDFEPFGLYPRNRSAAIKAGYLIPIGKGSKTRYRLNLQPKEE